MTFSDRWTSRPKQAPRRSGSEADGEHAVVDGLHRGSVSTGAANDSTGGKGVNRVCMGMPRLQVPTIRKNSLLSLRPPVQSIWHPGEDQ